MIPFKSFKMADEEYKFSKHLSTRMEERNLKEKWITNTLDNPDSTTEIDENEKHFFKRIIEAASRCLKVILNPLTNIVVTAHFDRRRTKNDCK